MKQKRRRLNMWQEFKVLILTSVGLKRNKKGSKRVKRYVNFNLSKVLITAIDKSLLTRAYLPSSRGLTGSLSAASMSFSQL